jgi:hypothetical protein
VTEGAGPVFNRARIFEVLDRHDVEYLVVGGVGAQLHGATRPTTDFDSLPSTAEENLGRLAAALRELGAFLRVGGLSDDESRTLPTRLDAISLGRLEVSTWRTDAGDLDVLTVLRRRDGSRVGYDELVDRATAVQVDGVIANLASLDDIIASKEFADRPKDREALDELRRLAEGGS